MSQLTVQLPDPVFNAARKRAEREALTLEEYVARMVSQSVDLDAEWDKRVQLGQQVSRERFLEILRKAPNVPPMPGDEIE